MQYFFTLDGSSQQGPLDKSQLKAAGVGPQTMVWREGMGDWQTAASVPDLAELFPATPPVAAGYAPQAGYGQQPGYATPQPGGPVDYGPPTASTSTNGMAIASFICGIVGLFGFCCCPSIVAAILAVVFGHIARGQIKRGQGTGDGFALTGLILGYVGIAVTLLGITISLTTQGLNWRNNNMHFNKFP